MTYPNASTVTYTDTGPQLQSVQEGSTTYARYSGFNALGQPSSMTALDRLTRGPKEIDTFLGTIRACGYNSGYSCSCTGAKAPR